MSAKSLVTCSTQAQSPWPCYSSAVVTNSGQRPDTTWLTHGADDPWASDVSMG